MSASTFTSNSAGGNGGGLANETGGTATCQRQLLHQPTPPGHGGGLNNSGTASVSGSTFTRNSATATAAASATAVRRV